MKLTLPVIASSVLCLLAGCTSEAQTYAKAHPELTTEQRKMFGTGKIPNGPAVAGLTRQQVRMIMGSDPTTFDKAGDLDTWVYAHEKAVAVGSDPATGPSASALDKHNAYSDTEGMGPRTDVMVKTIIYFNGDVAVRAQKTEDRQ